MFTRDDPALPMHYPGFVYRTLSAEGYHAADLLKGTDLTDEALKDPNHRFSFSSLRRLTRNALDLTGDTHLGINLGERFEATYVGLPAYAAMNAANFKDALNTLSRFFSMTFPTIEFSLRLDPPGEPAGGVNDENEVEVQLRPKFPLDDIGYFISGFGLVACDGLFRTILRQTRVTVRGHMMVSEPVGWATVSARIGFPISFGASKISLFLPTECLAMPLPGADPINHARLLALCEQSIASGSADATPVSLVIAYLEDAQNISSSLSETAAALGFSERGLRRKLEQSGATFRSVVDQVRYSRARDLLTSTTKPLSVIAFELGYDSPSNFARSFKRWSGLTPKAFREGRGCRAPVGLK